MGLEASSIVHASRHYERAGLRPQAYRASLSAAREASRISARQEAYELYQRAIANMPTDLPAGEQAELYERFADAAGAIERNEDSVEAATRARELYLEAGRPLDAAGDADRRCPSGESAAARHTTRCEAFAERALDEIAALPATPEREKLGRSSLSHRADASTVCIRARGCSGRRPRGARARRRTRRSRDRSRG